MPQQKSKLCINSSISLYSQYVEDVVLNCHEKLKIHSKLVIKHSLWVSAVCVIKLSTALTSEFQNDFRMEETIRAVSGPLSAKKTCKVKSELW